MSRERLYEITGQLYIVGTKNITVRCPRKMKEVLTSGTDYAPLVEFHRKLRDEQDAKNLITYFIPKVVDRNYVPDAGQPSKTYNTQIQIPPQFSRYIRNEGEVVMLDLTDPVFRQFMTDVDELLMCWYPEVMKRRDDENLPTTFHSRMGSESMLLKWPWKLSIDSYFQSFNEERNIHVLTLGVAYHNPKVSEIGVSLKLSQYPALTRAGALFAKIESQSKKRRLSEVKEEGEEVGTE